MNILPLLYSIPAGSLDSFSRYSSKLVSQNLKVSEVITCFSLRKSKNETAEYSEALFKKVRILAPEEQSAFTKYADDVRGLAVKMSNTVAALGAEVIDEEDPF